MTDEEALQAQRSDQRHPLPPPCKPLMQTLHVKLRSSVIKYTLPLGVKIYIFDSIKSQQ